VFIVEMHAPSKPPAEKQKDRSLEAIKMHKHKKENLFAIPSKMIVESSALDIVWEMPLRFGSVWLF
jgi:hypothetical protein